MQITTELDFLWRFAHMYRKPAVERTAHIICKKSSQTRRAAATGCFPFRSPLILLWLLIYLLHVRWLPSYRAGLPFSLCFSSSLNRGLSPVSCLPKASSQIQPSPLHHWQFPPMLGFSFILMSNFSPAHKAHPLPRLLHHQLKNSPMLKTL